MSDASGGTESVDHAGGAVPPLGPRDPLLAPPANPLPERVEDLALYDAQLDAIRREGAGLTAGLTDDQFNWRPDPRRWSIAQCLHHIVVVTDSFIEVQESAIDRAWGRRRLSDGPYRHGRLGSMIVAAIEPPVRWRFRAKRRFAPGDRYSLDMLLPAFQRRQDRLQEVIRSARGLDLGKVHVPIPGTPLVRLSLGQSLTFAVAHERRHLWQAREVRADSSFPRS